MYGTDFWTLWEKVRVGWSERIALKHVYYQLWNRSPVQVGCMRQVLRAGALGRPRGMEWSGRQEEGSGWGIHVYPWLIHVNVWQKPLQYCKVISLKVTLKSLSFGLFWWPSGLEFACQCRGHGFGHWSGKIPHTLEQLNLCSTITEPACLEPVLCKKEMRMRSPCATTKSSPCLPHLEKACAARKTQCRQKLIN